MSENQACNICHKIYIHRFDVDFCWVPINPYGTTEVPIFPLRKSST